MSFRHRNVIISLVAVLFIFKGPRSKHISHPLFSVIFLLGFAVSASWQFAEPSLNVGLRISLIRNTWIRAYLLFYAVSSIINCLPYSLKMTVLWNIYGCLRKNSACGLKMFNEWLSERAFVIKTFYYKEYIAKQARLPTKLVLVVSKVTFSQHYIIKQTWEN